MSSDSQLVHAAQKGEPEAFGEIVERYKQSIFGVALLKLRDHHDAEDVAQLTFVEAYQRIGDLRDNQRLGSWLRSIAHNRAVDRIRERLREQVTIDEPAREPPTPHQELEQQESRRRVWEALHRLRQPYREALILHYLSGLSIDEIAKILEVPEGTVKSRLNKARERLKRVTLSQAKSVMAKQKTSDRFSEGVIGLLKLYPNRGRMFDPVVGEPLKQADPAMCKEGFMHALAEPHWRTRRAAVHYMRLKAPGRLMMRDEILEVTKVALRDPNRAVRMGAAMVLHKDTGIWQHEWESEVAPLMFPLLQDPSRKVRRRVARYLSQWGGIVPLEVAVQAISNEEVEDNLATMQRLLRSAQA